MKRNRNRNKNRWISLAKALIILNMIILFINAYLLVVEVRRDVNYGSRSYGLSTLNDYFDEGDYQRIYLCTMSNKYANDEPEVDVSQYEAFGRYYHAYTMAKVCEDNGKYLEQMKAEKQQITWKKILSVIEELERDL